MVPKQHKWITATLFAGMISLIFTAFGWCQQAGIDSKTTIVSGTGLIKDNDAASAREKAISESLITAIGIVMADLTPVEILVPNFQSINELLYAHTDTFINGYKVLAETKYKNRYRVLVQARVSTQKIKSHLMGIGIMAGKIQQPKILLCIAEQNISDMTPHYWWGPDSLKLENKAQTTLTQQFSQKGFIILDPPEPSAYQGLDNPHLESPDPDPETVLALAKLVQADIVVVGRAFSELAANTMGEDIHSFIGTLHAQVFRVETAEEIGRTKQQVSTVNTNDIFGGLEAITQASTLAGEDLAVQITNSYRKKALERTRIKIVVQGTRMLSNFVKFRRTLSRLKNVGEIRSSEMKTNEATLNVEYGDPVQKLAESLMLQTFDAFGINISQVEKDQLHIILIPNTSPDAEDTEPLPAEKPIAEQVVE